MPIINEAEQEEGGRRLFHAIGSELATLEPSEKIALVSVIERGSWRAAPEWVKALFRQTWRDGR